MTPSKKPVQLSVAKQTWIEVEGIVPVKPLPKGTRIFCFDPIETVVCQGQLMSAKGIMEVRRKVPVDMLISNITSITVHVPKNMALCTYRDSMVNIFDPEQADKRRRQIIAKLLTTSTPSVQRIERVDTLNPYEYWIDTINIPP